MRRDELLRAEKQSRVCMMPARLTTVALPGLVSNPIRVAPGIQSPHVSQASVGIEHEQQPRNSITAEYTILRGAHLFRSRNTTFMVNVDSHQ